MGGRAFRQDRAGPVGQAPLPPSKGLGRQRCSIGTHEQRAVSPRLEGAPSLCGLDTLRKPVVDGVDGGPGEEDVPSLAALRATDSQIERSARRSNSLSSTMSSIPLDRGTATGFDGGLLAASLVRGVMVCTIAS